MVDERVTDGRRIGELLASELTGLGTGPLADVSHVDVDPDAEPTPEGTPAYRVAYQEAPVGTVRLFPERIEVALDADGGEWADALTAVGDRPGVDCESAETGTVLTVRYGAAVKAAVDVVRAGLAGAEDG